MDSSHFLRRLLTTLFFFFFQNEHFLDTEVDNFGKSSFPITGLILARRDSKGIPHKNMVDLNGHPLIHYALEQMINSQIFNTIWVSTNDPEVKKYVNEKKVGVQVHERAEYTATDEATSILAVQEFLASHPEIETVGLVQATSPLIKSSYLEKGLHLMKVHNLDSVFSVTRQWKLRWSAVNEAHLKFGIWTKSMNFNAMKRPRRQDWPGELIENGMFYFTRRKLVLAGLFQGRRSYYVEVPEEDSLEIDSKAHLATARILLEMRKESSSDDIELNAHMPSLEISSDTNHGTSNDEL